MQWMLKNTVGQRLYKLNNNIWEGRSNYQWKVLGCIISITITLFEKSIHNQCYINTLFIQHTGYT